jgi:hypothetical protein
LALKVIEENKRRRELEEGYEEYHRWAEYKRAEGVSITIAVAELKNSRTTKPSTNTNSNYAQQNSYQRPSNQPPSSQGYNMNYQNQNNYQGRNYDTNYRPNQGRSFDNIPQSNQRN